MKQFLTYNLIAFLAVLISRLIIVPFDHVDISIGNYIWLPMGRLYLRLCYLVLNLYQAWWRAIF